MTNLVLVKQALITRLKAESTVTSLLTNGATEVRELEWQGTVFKYPCVRVRVEEFQRHTPGSDCKLFDVSAIVYVFADDATSLKTDLIATAINDVLDTKSFSDVPTTTKFVGIKTKQVGAAWATDGGVWSANVQLTFQVS
jgi:hypothetical protein